MEWNSGQKFTYLEVIRSSKITGEILVTLQVGAEKIKVRLKMKTAGKDVYKHELHQKFLITLSIQHMKVASSQVWR